MYSIVVIVTKYTVVVEGALESLSTYILTLASVGIWETLCQLISKNKAARGIRRTSPTGKDF